MQEFFVHNTILKEKLIGEFISADLFDNGNVLIKIDSNALCKKINFVFIYSC